MSDFPGEDKNIPKRLIEAVARVPVDYLVPKVSLSSLLESPFAPSTVGRRDVFATPANNTQAKLQAVSFDVADGANQELLFKRPSNVPLEAGGADEESLFEGLSPFARECLAVSGQVSSENIRDEVPVQLAKPGKHLAKDTTDGAQVSLSTEAPAKKMKTGSGVTMNEVDLGKKYIQELDSILEIMSKEEEKNAEYWYTIADDTSILSEACLAKLSIILKNIVSVASLSHKVDGSKLLEILKLLVRGIKCANQRGPPDGEKEERIINKIAHTSAQLIFTIFMISTNDNRLSLEELVAEPIDLMDATIDYLLGDISDLEAAKEQALLLEQSVLLLPSYIEREPFIDASLTSKFVYLFAKLLMVPPAKTNVDLQSQNCWENLKDSSRNILVTLFRKFPEQREFIIDELLSHAEQTPLKRNQKKLRKCENGIYVTDFTLTIILMLETLTCFEYCKDLPEKESDTVVLLKEKFSLTTDLSAALASHVADLILKKFVESPSTYRHVIENYVHDLVAVLRHPQYAVSQNMLTVIFKRFLATLSSSQQLSANVETTVLQLLGLIGASIFEVKCATRPNEDSNLIKLVNYPENLPQLITSYENCIKFCLLKTREGFSAKYLWSQIIALLLKAIDYTKEDRAQNEKFTEILMVEIRRSQSLSGGMPHPRIGYVDIKQDYYSFLHAFDLMNLYEPYLKILLTLLESEKIKIKSTAIKCLSMLAFYDEKILSTPLVKHTIGKALVNSPASVKDAILDLISRGSSAEEYYLQINLNFDDESTLIRKHVLRMNENIYMASHSPQVKATVASRILLRMEDEEDSIIEMARGMLLKQWILSVAEEESPEKRLQVSKEVLGGMSGVASINEKCARHFEWFLNFFLLNEDMHTPEAFLSIKQCLNFLTDVLVQTITELQADGKEASIVWNKEHLLILLAKFGDCNVSFITKNHIIALYPYLMSDERSDLQYYILHVFKNIIENDSTFNIKFLHDLETTLLSRLPRMNVREISEAMPLIWCVATHQKDTGRVLKACFSCFQHLTPYVNQVTKNPEISAEGKLQRLIYLATGFARYCHFTSLTGKPSLVGDEESVYAFVAKRLLVLSRNGVPHIIRRVAIKNLVQLCGSHPKLFNSKPILALLNEELEADSLDIKLVILESLYDFFIAEERRSILKAGVNGSISSNERLKKKLLKEKKVESVNDGVCSALVARFLKHVLNVCRLADIKSSLVAVRLLKLTLEYGYANPSHCIPTVISLVASSNEYMKHVATEILKDLFEKYETMVFSGITQGVKLAIEYSQFLEGSNFCENKMFLKSLQHIVGTGKKNSTRYFKSVFKMLRVHFGKIHGAHTDIQTRNALLFILANLSFLSFPTQYELVDLLKNIETETEQLTESLIDEFQDEENIDVSKNIENTFVVQSCLKKLKSFLVAEYGLKIDASTVEGAQALEYKKKQLTSTLKHDFPGALEEMIAKLTDQVILEDLTNMVRQAS